MFSRNHMDNTPNENEPSVEDPTTPTLQPSPNRTPPVRDARLGAPSRWMLASPLRLGHRLSRGSEWELWELGGVGAVGDVEVFFPGCGWVKSPGNWGRVGS